MKLAEALILRADLNVRQEELRSRLANNALAQEGELPTEDPMELLKEVSANAQQLEELISRINLTNAATKQGEKTLTELLARRDVLTQKVSIIRTLLDSASKQVMRGSRMEVKVHSTVPVADLRKQADRLSKELRTLDTEIQAANWLVELK